MKFGVFFELSVPRPFTPGIEKQVYDHALEQARLADQLGFDQLWAVEHHFLEEYSHCSSPEIFLTACAMSTKHIRVGFGIATCVPQYSHPVRIAERTATLDIISNGRVEVGTGRSGTWTELGGLGADPDETKATWDEYVRVLPKMWMQERFSWSGRSFSMPERAIIPKPVQKPHPPMWVACTSPGTELEAADRGLGALGVTLGTTIDVQEKHAAEYRRRIQQCDPVGAFVNEQVNNLGFLFCHEDVSYAAETGNRFANLFGYLGGSNLSARQVYPTPSYHTEGLLPALRAQPVAIDEHGIAESRTIGDPDRLIRVIKRWESAGIDRINFILNTAESVPQQEVLDSMRLFAREVMPAFGVFPPEPAAIAGEEG